MTEIRADVYWAADSTTCSVCTHVFGLMLSKTNCRVSIHVIEILMKAECVMNDLRSHLCSNVVKQCATAVQQRSST